jgi:hypothetical protein
MPFMLGRLSVPFAPLWSRIPLLPLGSAPVLKLFVLSSSELEITTTGVAMIKTGEIDKHTRTFISTGRRSIKDILLEHR